MPTHSVRFATEQNKPQEKSESERDSAVLVEKLDLAAGDKIDSISKVFWSRKRDEIFARLSIRRSKPAGQARNLALSSGLRSGRTTANENITIPLKQLKK